MQDFTLKFKQISQSILRPPETCGFMHGSPKDDALERTATRYFRV